MTKYGPQRDEQPVATCLICSSVFGVECPAVCDCDALVETVSLDAAREALADLHTMARGHDYANEHDLNRMFLAVDEALDELEELRRRNPQDT